MVDLLGNKLEIGDKVATLMPYYRQLIIGEIIRFTKCLAVVAHNGDELKQASFQLVKVHQCSSQAQEH